MEWRDGKRPDDALLIVVLLDRRSGRPADANTVATHDGKALLALIIEDGGVHFMAVLSAEQEDLSDFDPFGERQHSLSSGRRIAGLRIAKIGKLFHREIADEIGVLIVGVGFIGAGDDDFHALNSVIR